MPETDVTLYVNHTQIHKFKIQSINQLVSSVILAACALPFLIKGEREREKRAGGKEEVSHGCKPTVHQEPRRASCPWSRFSPTTSPSALSPSFYRGRRRFRAVTWQSWTGVCRELLNKGAAAWVPVEERLVLIWIILVEWVNGNLEAKSVLESRWDVSVTLSQGATPGI